MFEHKPFPFIDLQLKVIDLHLQNSPVIMESLQYEEVMCILMSSTCLNDKKNKNSSPNFLINYHFKNEIKFTVNGVLFIELK